MTVMLVALAMTLGAAVFSNAHDYPANFTPYAASSVFNAKVSAHPKYLADSAAIVALQFPAGRNPNPVRATEAGQFDYNHPWYFATATDPVVTLRCTTYCGAPDNGGVPATIHVPAKARPARGTDGHFDVVQADGTEISMWGAKQPAGDWTPGDTITAQNVANCGSFTSGPGWLRIGPGATAAGFCTNAGIVTAAELIDGTIDHALFVVGPCAVGTQYPAERTAGTGRCTSGLGPPLGGREWYDVPCAATRANGALEPWEKAILCALNVYGAYVADDNAAAEHYTGGVTPMLESEEPWYDFDGPGYTSPFAPLAAQGWYTRSIPGAVGSSPGTRWVGAAPWNPPGVDWEAHIHWLAPCSAEGTC